MIGVANFVFAGPAGDIQQEALKKEDWNSCLFEDQSDWGTVLRVLPPGTLNGRRAAWLLQAGILGSHSAKFE